MTKFHVVYTRQGGLRAAGSSGSGCEHITLGCPCAIPYFYRCRDRWIGTSPIIASVCKGRAPALPRCAGCVIVGRWVLAVFVHLARNEVWQVWQLFLVTPTMNREVLCIAALSGVSAQQTSEILGMQLLSPGPAPVVLCDTVLDRAQIISPVLPMRRTRHL
ncbi:hypothetical protein PAPYR_4639 [Paratrimastix pyriformis]|uniref:Uncharacterized protein n=1 Tax=Paratrimastix pyriformis TaxID=342808 RepID=A0ABQ8UJF1_9EUKA|nr:hypothetical protein PAPYR_4639 [Paratrimastix pyriformis]